MGTKKFQQMNKPDWSIWKHMPEAEQWQACALALDIDPDSLKHECWVPGQGTIPRECFSSDETYEQFGKLVRLLKAHRFGGVHFTLNHKASVTLPEFAAWCVQIELDIPRELKELAGKAEKISNSPLTLINDDFEEIPGKLPPTAAGKLAIKAAWQIECITKRHASAKDVMTQLQEWASSGKEPDVLAKSLPAKRAVQWTTTKGKDAFYTLDACGKTLKKWNDSRK